ncbi:MAG: hypothetical protein R3C97_14645 [Geminicoccaceae bacterium]
MFTDAPALYCRADLLEKHGKTAPSTWAELEETAKAIVEAEGNPDLFGFVFRAFRCLREASPVTPLNG